MFVSGVSCFQDHLSQLTKHRSNLELWIVWGWSDYLMRLAYLLGVVFLVRPLALFSLSILMAQSVT